MDLNMSTGSGQKLRIVRGGLYGTRRRRIKVVGHRPELSRLDARKHLAYLRLCDSAGSVPTEGIQRIREGVTHPWRVEGRRFLEMKAAGVALEDAVAVAMETVYWLLEDVWNVTKFLPHNPRPTGGGSMRIPAMRDAA